MLEVTLTGQSRNICPYKDWAYSLHRKVEYTYIGEVERSKANKGIVMIHFGEVYCSNNS